MSNCGSWVYDAVSAAERMGRRSFHRELEPRSSNNLYDGQALTGQDLAEIVEGLKRKLAWYGFRSVALGPFIKLKDDTIAIDLFVRGLMLGHVEVNRYSGAIKRWFLAEPCATFVFSDADAADRACPALRSISG